MNTENNRLCVRRADSNDGAAISILADQLGYPNSLNEMQKRLQAILINPDQTIFVVDFAQKKTAGYIHAIKLVLLEVEPLVEVGGLVIDQQFRRLGLGKLLLIAAEGWAKEIGCKQIRLHSNIVRTEAHLFYTDMGYSINKTQYSFVKSLT